MIVYLHGFNSGGASSKAGWLRGALAPVTVLSPTYPAHRADEAVAYLLDYVAHARRASPHDRLVLIGSSLGGYWAQYLAPEVGARLVLINPSIHPYETLAAHSGWQKNEVTGERYLLSDDDVQALRKYAIGRCHPRVPTLLLLDAGDELLDYRVAEAFYRGCGRTIVYPDGSHRFDHLAQSLAEIRSLHDD